MSSKDNNICKKHHILTITTIPCQAVVVPKIKTKKRKKNNVRRLNNNENNENVNKNNIESKNVNIQSLKTKNFINNIKVRIDTDIVKKNI